MCRRVCLQACVCLCESGNHLCLHLQLRDGGIEIWRGEIWYHTPQKPNLCVTDSAGVRCLCACTVQYNLQSLPKMHDIKTPVSRFFLRHFFSLFSIFFIFFFYLCAHIRLRRIRGHVANFWSTQRESEERQTETKSFSERRGYTKRELKAWGYLAHPRRVRYFKDEVNTRRFSSCIYLKQKIKRMYFIYQLTNCWENRRFSQPKLSPGHFFLLCHNVCCLFLKLLPPK